MREEEGGARGRKSNEGRGRGSKRKEEGVGGGGRRESTNLDRPVILPGLPPNFFFAQHACHISRQKSRKLISLSKKGNPRAVSHATVDLNGD
jgi:hypothetical protein